jgi:hypothetical protein
VGGGFDCTVTDAVPDLVVSCVLVAVTVTVAAEAGAVNSPPALMVPPPVTDHVTAELKPPVPWTVAVHCEVALTVTVDGVQRGETEETVEAVVCGCAGLALSPQDVRTERARQARAQRRRFFKGAAPRRGCKL